jgi:heteromeric Ino2p/Ino4p transcription factor
MTSSPQTPTASSNSNTNNANGARLTDKQKKANHIASEAKRRGEIRDGFDVLASIIPGMEGNGRSEAVVLQATVEFLREEIAKKDRLIAEAEKRGEKDVLNRFYGDEVTMAGRKTSRANAGGRESKRDSY